MSAPLDGIRVIDLTRARSGPTCVRQLADLGADVVQVADPRGSELAGSDGWNLHRGKRSIVIDMRNDAGRAVLLRLVAGADVLVENFRPGVKHRLRIDPETLWQHNPRLVYASISGFGQDGPYADRPGVDQIAQGLGGLMSVTGPPGSGPWRAGIAISDTASGTLLTQGVLAALIARGRTGRGQWVHTSLLEAMVNFMDFQAARWLNEGEVPQQAGNDHPTLALMGAFPALDGFVNIAGLGEFSTFCDAIEAPELLADPRFANAEARRTNRSALRAEVETRTRLRPCSEWVERLTKAGLPCGPVLGVDEVFADPQVRHLDLVTQVTRGNNDSASVLRYPVRFSDTEAVRPAHVPASGQHTSEVLAELGYSPHDIDALLASGAVASLRQTKPLGS